MRYLHTDDRTQQALRIWMGKADLCTPAYFFWNPGNNPLERNAIGMMRSLSYQIIKSHEYLAALATKDEIAQIWTERRLRQLLYALVQQSTENIKLCFFIDGLDELDGEIEEFLRMLDPLAKRSNVKICISSRPWKIFEDQFKSVPMLRLHQLTQKDIETYVNDKVVKARQSMSGSAGILDDREIADLTSTIADRAEGVFLWVRLAVADMLTGLRNADTYENLQQRLQRLPTEISDLYSHMLSTQDPFYKAQARRYFRLVLAAIDPLSLVDMALLDLDSSHINEIVDLRSLWKQCNFTHTYLLTRCAGLLEIKTTNESNVELLVSNAGDGSDYQRSGARAVLAKLANGTKIDLTHRSARDFVIEKSIPSARQRCSVGDFSSELKDLQEMYSTLFKGLSKMFEDPTKSDKALRKALGYCFWLGQCTGEPQDLIMEAIEDYVGMNIDTALSIGYVTLQRMLHSLRKFSATTPTTRGIAAWWQMSKYVKGTFRGEPGEATHLLNCAVNGSHHFTMIGWPSFMTWEDSWTVWAQSRIELLDFLLSEGANPNAVVEQPSKSVLGNTKEDINSPRSAWRALLYDLGGTQRHSGNQRTCDCWVGSIDLKV